MNNMSEENQHARPAASEAYESPVSLGPIWVGLVVEPVTTVCPVTLKCIRDELIWVRDLNHATRVCKHRQVRQVVVEWQGRRVAIDYADAESFADFINGCRDELALNPPTFDDATDERLVRDAIALAYSHLERANWA